MITPAFGEDNTAWAFTVSVSAYMIPDESYVSPVFSADKDRIHLEARYNDEDKETGSIFGGYNFHSGNTLELNVTPLIGIVFGRSDGIAPGFEVEMNYRNFTVSSEGEYFFSSAEKESNFFYSWSEVSYAPTDWFWFGIAGQRTRAYKTDLEIQRGFLLGFGVGNFSLTGYVMNPGWDDAFAMIHLGYEF